MDGAVVRHPRLLRLRAQGRQSIEEQAKQAGMSDRIQQIMVPMEEVVEVRRGQKVNAERKFFPGYVLVKMEMTDDTWHLVKNTPKVTGFRGRGRPTLIADAEAARILHQVQEGIERPAVHHLRDRRAGVGVRRTLHLVQRTGRGG